MGPAIDAFFKFAVVALVLFVPLGLWKLGEILVWLCTHVRIGVS